MAKRGNELAAPDRRSTSSICGTGERVLRAAARMSSAPESIRLGCIPFCNCSVTAATSARCASSPKSDRWRAPCIRRSIASLSAIATSTTEAAPLTSRPAAPSGPAGSFLFPATPNCVSKKTASRKPASFRTLSKASCQACVVASATREISAPSATSPITSFHPRVAGSVPIRM